jgi:3-oxoacyl-[acyl-carrier-protein] synthase-3
LKPRRIKVLGTGKYLPKTIITAEALNQRIGSPAGWIEKHSGVLIRHFVQDETASKMGAEAARQALSNAGLTLADIDCLVCTSGTMEQNIPSTAALIHRELGGKLGNIPAFDINATCLSFLTGLDTMSYLVDAGRYERILLVATEVASAGLDWSDKESCSIFGDGAAAVIIGKSPPADSSAIIASHMETHSDGANLTEYRGGGTRQPGNTYQPGQAKDFTFQMDGRGVFRMASKLMPDFFQQLLHSGQTPLDSIKLVIPHQASLMSMRLVRKKLGIPAEKFMVIAENHGNTIAASIPMGLHEAIQQQRIQRGDRVMLLGTSAGFSLGGLIFDY